MKTLKIQRYFGVFMLISFLGLAVAGCNSSSSDDTTYLLSSSTAVTGFKLNRNSKVMDNLDSVYFSIDLEHGVIFNADSLPMGTDVSKLVPSITYASGCSGVFIRMSGGTVREGEVNYMVTPNDSIDFTGNVTLSITAQDGQTTNNYRLKVNVHKVNPDSLAFSKEEISKFPSRNPSPVAQKTVEFDGGLLSLVKESDGSWTRAVSKANNPSGGWTLEQVAPGFDVNVRSLTSNGTALYLLAEDGKMYTSADGRSWSENGKVWQSILGAYGTDILGIRQEGGKLLHTSLSGNLPENELEVGFPVSGASNMLSIKNKWAVEPMALLTGGKDSEGKDVLGTWGFDGHSWVNLSSNPAPSLQGATMVPYFIYKQTSALWLQSEFPMLMMFGGRKADGKLNDKTYITIDNGINWVEAPVNLSLPKNVPSTMNADALLLSTPMSGSLAGAWKLPARNVKQRLNYEINGYDIMWECPYIHLFGGEMEDGKLSDVVWRGVLTRLQFIPLV